MGREIQSLGRGLDILALLAEADEPIGVTAIARALAVDKSTAFHLLSTLASRGFVEQGVRDRRYKLGLRIVELSRRALDRIELRAVAKPCLKLLQQRVGEAAHLAVLADRKVVYIDAVESGANLNVNTEIGRQAPAHCTAIGKALIAWLPTEKLVEFLGERTLKRYTPRTITTLRELVPHLETIQERGYAVDDEEFDPGVRCVAAAVRDYGRKVVASVGISGPAIRVTLDRIPDIGKTVMETAHDISRLLGYQQTQCPDAPTDR